MERSGVDPLHAKRTSSNPLECGLAKARNVRALEVVQDSFKSGRFIFHPGHIVELGPNLFDLVGEPCAFDIEPFVQEGLHQASRQESDVDPWAVLFSECALGQVAQDTPTRERLIPSAFERTRDSLPTCVLLAEQTYRAAEIRRGSGYHK